MPKKQKKEIPSLVRALDFVALAQHDTGPPYKRHVMLRNNTAVAFDGILAAGHLIDESIQSTPNTIKLLQALKKCNGPLALAQMDNTKLSIKCGKFKAYVECIPDSEFPTVFPDPVAGHIDNRIREGFLTVAPFVIENSPRVVLASALLRANTIVVTTGYVLIEYWHGWDLPPNMIVPKRFINALGKIDKDIVSFGFSSNSLTIYFKDNSWVKTQLYNDKFPDTDSIMNKMNVNNLKPIPEGFFDGVEAIGDFIEDNHLKLRPGCLQSHNSPDVGAVYDVEGISCTKNLDYKHMKLLSEIMTQADFEGISNISFFYGNNVRGALSQIRG